MANPSAEQLTKLIDKITSEWADKGKLVEGGWMAYVATSSLETAPEIQRKEMRKAYFLGAQHLYASIMGIMDADREPTARDMQRMSLTHNELEAFRRSLVN